MTRFQNVPLELIGGTDQGHSVQQNHELSQNSYIYVSGGVPAMKGTPGSTLFAAATSNAVDRGMHVFNDELYQVSGTTLEKIASDGTRTSIGSIAGSARCIFADDGTNMMIAVGGTLYRYNTSLSEVVNALFESPNSVSYLNRQFLYDGSGNRFVVSEVGDGTDIQADNYARAESSPDELLATYTFEQKSFLLGAKTIEPWYNSGTGSPPFDRIDTSIIQKGVGSIYSVSNTDSAMYFLGDDLNVYQMANNQMRSIANAGIAKEINAMSVTNDAIGFCFNLEGQDFYYIVFPTGNKSFLFSETVNDWFSMTYGVSGARHMANSYAYVYGKHLIADYATGRVLEWSLSVNEDVGEVIQRRRVLPVINGALINAPNRRLLMSSIEISMQKGLGLASGQGSDPILNIEMSFDGGHSWDTIHTIRSGEAGNFDGKVVAYTMQSFYDATCRITQTDPIDFNIRAATIRIGPGGY